MKKYIISILIILAALFAFFGLQGQEDVYKGENKKTEEKQTPPTPPVEQTPLTSEEKVQKLLNDMSLYEKICQMLIVTPESITGYQTVTKAGDVMKSAVEKYPVGGVIYFDKNIENASQLKEMIENTQKYTDIPMFISVDQEGGIVARLKDNVGNTIFKNMYTYRNGGVKTAFENAQTMGREMKKLGFNLDFAPVADVWSNKSNTVIGERAYSHDFKEAAKLVPEAVKGFHDAGIMCTLKHFPGHGDTFADSHSASAYVTKSKKELDRDEMLPFKAGIEAGADMVMMGHLIVKSIDKTLPASMSGKIVNEYLRKELGFDGVVITDSLAMGAVANLYTSGESALLAVKAGVDILLMPTNVSSTVSAIENAVKNGELTEERINESVKRILELKEKNSLL